jgi:hypothetical protein
VFATGMNGIAFTALHENGWASPTDFGAARTARAAARTAYHAKYLNGRC